MEPILRSAAIYAFLLLVMRVSGKRTLASITTFDFVLLLVVGEATQQALLGSDVSVTNGFLVITALVGIDVLVSLVKERSTAFATLVEGVPLVIVENGKPLVERMEKSRVDLADVLASGRQSHGIEKLEQIKYAVLEKDGMISVIPKKG